MKAFTVNTINWEKLEELYWYQGELQPSCLIQCHPHSFNPSSPHELARTHQHKYNSLSLILKLAALPYNSQQFSPLISWMGDPFIDDCKRVSHQWGWWMPFHLLKLVPRERGIRDGFLVPSVILGRIQRGKWHRRSFKKIPWATN